ncbi:sensor histidine kinase [Falsiroseomonas sp.]|uniref:sensor histidine kinase n=1 Tax=Falsiroseomonas sp. TaxID=2870721 RepID=UPI0035667BD6
MMPSNRPAAPEAAIDFQSAFEAVPSPCLLLDADPPRFTILAATDAYLAATGSARGQLLGLGIFEAFPDRPDDPGATGVRELRASLERVLAQRAPDTMAVQKYDIPRRDGRPGFDPRYWSPINAPVLRADGSVARIVHRVEDVTDYVLLERSAAANDRDAAREETIRRSAWEVQEANRRLKAANEKLRRVQIRLGAALDVGRQGAWEINLATGEIERSPVCDEILGLSGAQGRMTEAELRMSILPEDRARVAASFRDAMAREVIWAIEFRIRRADNGAPRWVRVQGRPFRDTQGRITHLLGVLTDVTQRRRADERQLLLLAELNHRVKNAYAAVQAIVTYTLKGASSLDEARKTLMGRLLALSRAQDILTRTGGGGALLADVVRQTLAPFLGEDTGAARVTNTGPELALAPKAVIALHTVFHELAMNAAKHGALSTPEGRIHVEWSLASKEEPQMVTLTWSEHGGPPVSAPPRRGFGTRLVERSVVNELGGRLETEYRPEGLVLRMRFRLSSWAWLA